MPQYGRSKVGFPIRKSLDQSSFAAPQGLSQRTTSFIASQRQGIHRMPLYHFITLMIDVRRHSLPRGSGRRHHQKDHWVRISRSELLPNISEQRCGQASPVFADGTRPAAIGYVPSIRCERSRTTIAREAFDLDRPSEWWSQTGSNRRPHACKARALPTELWPRESVSAEHGGPGTTRTSDLTLIRGAL